MHRIRVCRETKKKESTEQDTDESQDGVPSRLPLRYSRIMGGITAGKREERPRGLFARGDAAALVVSLFFAPVYDNLPFLCDAVAPRVAIVRSRIASATRIAVSE